MRDVSGFKYRFAISIFIVVALLIPPAINLNSDFFSPQIRSSKYGDPNLWEGIEPELIPNYTTALPQHRGTRSLESEYASLVDYSDVLIVRNLNSAVSMEIADYFQDQRNIPNINVCNITTSTAETINRATFDSQIRGPVETHINSNSLLGIINFIVTTKDVPLRISEVNTGDDDWTQPYTIDRASVDSELTLILGGYSGYIGGGGFMMPTPSTYIRNPYYNSYNVFSQSTYDIFLVTRLTAYNITQVKTLIDKVPEAVGRKGSFVFDRDPGKSGDYVEADNRMGYANGTLTAKGLDVVHDDTTTYLTNIENASGYTSWGSNDANYPKNSLLNTGLETDTDGDGVPDNWHFVHDVAVGNCSRNSTDSRNGIWSVKISRNATNDNASYVAQNYTVKPDTRYYAVGYVNLSGVSSDAGAHLQFTAYDSEGEVVKYYNGSARTGTTTSWVSLSQVIYEPLEGITNISLGCALSQSSGTVFVDDLRLYEIKPHNSWIPGALVETYVSTSGRTFNYPTSYGQSLAADLILDGVSGTKAYVYEPYISACAHPDILFDAYTDGFYSAESYYMASEFLGWMDVVVCDPKLAVYKRSMIQDLAIFSGDITFSDNEPINGDIIDIFADVHNLGNYTATEVVVRYYVGDPQAGGTLIGETVLDVAAHSQNQTQLSWNTTGFSGAHDIYVLVDAQDRFYELSENNNIASSGISVYDSFDIILEPGWNLISLPIIQTNTSLSVVLDSIFADYNDVRLYDIGDANDPWKHYHDTKPSMLNDLYDLDHTQGFWIHVINPSGTTLTVKGLPPETSEGIPLYRGWNLVGYPSRNDYLRDVGLNNTVFGTDIFKIMYFNASTEQWMELSGSDSFKQGTGYWIYSIPSGNIVWNVPV